MTDYKAAARRAFGYEGLPSDWSDFVEASLHPRSPEMLFDVAATAGIKHGDVALDAGCRDGRHMRELVDRFGCSVVGVDLVESGLVKAVTSVPHNSFGLACADIEYLPFGQASLDFVWCRDVLEMTENPSLALAEFLRVLRPGGGVMLYVAFATEALEPQERARLFAALGLHPTGMSERVVEEAIATLGFEVLAKERVSPEWIEHGIEKGDRDDWSTLTIARMRRARAELEEKLGSEWYERIYAWACWQPYLLLGKLQTVAWALCAPVG